MVTHNLRRDERSLETQDEIWPHLPLEAWQETYATLHLWMQMVGKIRLKLSPSVNHWWETAFYVNGRGLTTSPIPYGFHAFEIQFDFIDHALTVHTSCGGKRFMALSPRSVADFYGELMALLKSLDIHVQINLLPSEIANPIAFDQDFQHHSYDAPYAQRWWQILLHADRIFKKFRGEFIGKSSPVHFFWGSFDLAVTRFSGRKAPPRPEADAITQEGYSHELMSVGFWPGSGNIAGPAFYAYAAPEPSGFNTSPVRPAAAFYNPATLGFVLRYEDVRQASDPDQMVLDFLHSTYDAAADRGRWDRQALERQPSPLAAVG